MLSIILYFSIHDPAPYKVLLPPRDKSVAVAMMQIGFFDLIKINALLCEMNLYVGAPARYLAQILTQV